MVMREGEVKRFREQLHGGGGEGEDVEEGGGGGAITSGVANAKVPSPSLNSSHSTHLLTRGGMTMDQLSLYPPGTIMHLVSAPPLHCAQACAHADGARVWNSGPSLLAARLHRLRVCGDVRGNGRAPPVL